MSGMAVVAERQRGLSLLEVLVALVILAGFGAALFSWAGQTLQSANRAVAMQRETEVASNLTELAVSLNPELRPEGTIETATHRYRWRSTLLQGPVDQVRHPAGESPFQVALFNVQFTVTGISDGREVAVGERTVAGHKLVRGMASRGLFGGAPALTPP